MDQEINHILSFDRGRGIALAYLRKISQMLITPPLSPNLAAVAKKICELGCWNVSNLRLQKLLYLCQMFSLGRTGKPIINEQFEAWMYGPVIPQLYRKMKVFGASPVSDRFYEITPLQPDIESLIAEVCGALKDRSDAVLVASTHREGGAWAKNYNASARNVPIPNNDILDEYRIKTRQ